MDSINAYAERIKFEQKRSLTLIYELGNVIGNRVAMIFDSKHEVKPMELYDLHKDLFGEEIEEELEEQRRLEMAQKQTNSRLAFAAKWNPILREKYGRHSQTTSSPTE